MVALGSVEGAREREIHGKPRRPRNGVAARVAECAQRGRREGRLVEEAASAGDADAGGVGAAGPEIPAASGIRQAPQNPRRVGQTAHGGDVPRHDPRTQDAGKGRAGEQSILAHRRLRRETQIERLALIERGKAALGAEVVVVLRHYGGAAPQHGRIVDRFGVRVERLDGNSLA